MVENTLTDTVRPIVAQVPRLPVPVVSSSVNYVGESCGKMSMDEKPASTVEGRIRRLEDKESIRELAVRYGDYIDQRDPVGLRSVVTDDVRFLFTNGRMDLNGADEIVDFFTRKLNEV